MSKILNSKVIIFVFLLIVFYLLFCKIDFTNGQNQTELDYSVNIISNKNYKDDRVISVFFTIIGNNPETNKLDTFNDGRWFSSVSDYQCYCFGFRDILVLRPTPYIITIYYYLNSIVCLFFGQLLQ